MNTVFFPLMSNPTLLMLVDVAAALATIYFLKQVFHFNKASLPLPPGPKGRSLFLSAHAY